MTQLICDNLSLGYEGKTVIEGLSFELEAGGFLCIAGDNGVGKSTLLKAILGLKKPLAGKINMDEISPGDLGYLPQHTAVQKDFPATVKEIVLSGAISAMGLRPFYSKEERRLAENNMRLLGIGDLADECYRDLSGGQQQRTLLARALCSARKALILDEPTAGLDTKAETHMYEIIDELNKKNGLTVIMVSHDIQAALKYAGHILHISRTGFFFGSAQEYLQSEPYRDIAERRQG